jgi:hypothetical protein
MKRLEHNVTTGEVTEIEMTTSEIEQFETEAQAGASRIASLPIQTAEAKLAALGLTADDLKALGLGGN